MPFGKYKDKRMAEVPATYLLWLFDGGGLSTGNVKDYILDNMEGLRKEAAAQAKRR